MARLILRRTGRLRPEEGDLARLRKLPGCQIVDESARALLVEATAEGQAQISSTFPDWIVTAEQQDLTIPDPRPGIKSTAAED